MSRPIMLRPACSRHNTMTDSTVIFLFFVVCDRPCVYSPSCLRSGASLTLDTRRQHNLSSLRKLRAARVCFLGGLNNRGYAAASRLPRGSREGYNFGASFIGRVWSFIPRAFAGWGSASGSGVHSGSWVQWPNCPRIWRSLLSARFLRCEWLALLRLVQWNLSLHLTLASQWQPACF